MPYLLPLVIWTSWQLINGGIEWSVIEKATDYGQNVTLFCNVSNCCPELAGWDRWTPVQRTLYIDVKTGRPGKKYDGNALTDGYTLIIQNISKQDLNVSYSCLYGITFSEKKYLLEQDVFMYISTTEPNVPADDDISFVGEIVSILVAVAVLVIAGLSINCFWKRQTRNRHNTNNKEAPPPDEELPLIEIPKKIGINEKNVYLDAIKSGTEVRQYVRIQVIGKDRVGKTSLVRRILHAEDGKYDGKSTDGIEIERNCQIRKNDGKFIVGEVETEKKERIRRIMHAFNKNQKAKELLPDLSLPLLATECDLETEKMQNNLPNSSPKKIDETEKKQNRQERGRSTGYSLETNENQNEYETIQSRETKIGTDTLINSPKIHIDTHDTTKSELEQLPHLSVLTPRNQVFIGSETSDKITEFLIENMNEILHDFEKEKEIMKSEGLVKCGIWDFAGQKDYYATHQTFFIPHAIYLLVTDMKDDIKAIKHDGVLDFDSIGDYIDFWFDSIHCFCKDHSARKLCPPVIMVCTGTDKFEKVEESKIQYDKTFSQTFGKQKKIDHRRGIYFISNTKFGKKDIEEIQLLKNHISEIANDMNYFAEKLPTKWIHLEHALEALRDGKIDVYSWENMEKLAKSNLMEEEELIPFLNYQHKIGNIIFFMEIKEYIILQPVWLVKCFRCLVCDCHPGKRNLNLINPTAWATLESTGELSKTLINQLFQKEPSLKFVKHKAYLLAVMEKFDIIVKPRFINTIDDKRHTSESYYMPCMITKSSSYELIKNTFIENNSDVNITPWLVLEFKFLPLAYFNHIMFHYIRNNEVCTVNTNDLPLEAIYRGKAVFYLDGLRKFIICFSHNAISLQIWEWGGIKDAKQDIYKMMLNNLCDNIESIKGHLGQNISYCIKAKCSTGDYSKTIGRVSFRDLTQSGKYMCEEHRCTHSNEDIEHTWLKHAEQLEDNVQISSNDSLVTVTETVTDSVIEPDYPNEPLEQHVQNSINDSVETVTETVIDSGIGTGNDTLDMLEDTGILRKHKKRAPSPPTNLKTSIDNGGLVLSWTSPIQNLFKVKYYKVLYTSNNWMDTDHIRAEANTSSCNIPNIIPQQEYRFKIASCMTNVVGNPSKEIILYSGGPNQPREFKTFSREGHIILEWKAPEEILFQTESYYLEVTNDDWKTIRSFSLSASQLHYDLPDVTANAIYRFKLHTICHSVMSLPTKSICYTRARHPVKVQLEHELVETFSDCSGNQVIYDIDFSEG